MLGAALCTCSQKEAELGECQKDQGTPCHCLAISVSELSVWKQRERLINDAGGRFAINVDILVS